MTNKCTLNSTGKHGIKYRRPSERTGKHSIKNTQPSERTDRHSIKSTPIRKEMIRTVAHQTLSKCDECTHRGNPYICRQCSRFYHDQYDGSAWKQSTDSTPDSTEPVKARVIVPKTGREYYVSRAVYLQKHQMPVTQNDVNFNYTEMGEKPGVYYYRAGWYEPLMGSNGAYLPIPDQVIEWAKISRKGVTP